MNPRATKIVATLGPASNTPEILYAMIEAGVNVVRLNFSHGTADEHRQRAAMVRAAAQRAGREVAIMADLQGPKIRVGKFEQGRVTLQAGQPFVLDAARSQLGDEAAVGLDYKNLPDEVRAGDVLLLNNWTTLHRRSAFTDGPAPRERRHLLRIWLSMPDSRPIASCFEEHFGATAAGALRGGMRPVSGTAGLT